MPVPVVNSINPPSGESLGREFVKITGSGFLTPSAGGSVKVFFGGVQSPSAHAISSTEIACLTPTIQVGAYDVEVQNITPGDPDIVESVVVPGGFEFKRISIAIPQDYSKHPCILKVTRSLIIDLRNSILENTQHDVHPEYVDPFGASLNEEAQSSAPHLKVVGPEVEEDRFYSFNEPQASDPILDSFQVYDRPVGLKLEYEVFGVGTTKGEVTALYEAFVKYLSVRTSLAVFSNGQDDSGGVIPVEMAPIWEQRGSFAQTPNRDGKYQFRCRIKLRGVNIVKRQVAEGYVLTQDPEVTPVSFP